MINAALCRIAGSVPLICLGVLALLAVGCATSPKVQVVQMGDDQLTCRELLSEMRRLDEAQANVELSSAFALFKGVWRHRSWEMGASMVK